MVDPLLRGTIIRPGKASLNKGCVVFFIFPFSSVSEFVGVVLSSG